MSQERWHDLGPAHELAPGGLRSARVEDSQLCVGRTGSGRLFALDDVCPHAGGSLAEGIIDGEQVICPLHAYAFEIGTGVCPDDPRCSIRTYAIRSRGGLLQVMT